MRHAVRLVRRSPGFTALCVLTLGLRPGWRRRGIDALLYLRVYEDGLAAGYRRAECSWILEDNLEMRRAMERIGGKPYKRYRIYERQL
jgi:L-amino acid N-acyltransferase YncA